MSVLVRSLGEVQASIAHLSRALCLLVEIRQVPIYEYRCESCNFEFEKLQKMSDEALLECPECHQSSLKKKISAAGFRLSGGGWYETDFKKGDKKKNLAGEEKAPAAEKSESKKSSEGSTATKTTESKPAKPSAS